LVSSPRTSPRRKPNDSSGASPLINGEGKGLKVHSSEFKVHDRLLKRNREKQTLKRVL